MKQKEHSEKYTGFLRGSLAGIISGAVTHPIDLIKVRLQINDIPKQTMVKTARNIIKNEGFIGLYSGISASLIRQGSFIGMKFGIYELWKNKFENENNPISFSNKLLGGIVAGGITGITCTPFDVCLVRMQSDNTLAKADKRNYKNGFDALYRITSEEGFLTLWKGSAPTFYRACIITSTQLGVYDEVKEKLIQTGYFGKSLTTYTISTLCCSLISGIVSNPFDIAKSRLMHSNNHTKYNGTISVISYILKNEGPISLTKGLNAAILRQIPLNLLRFNLVEILKVYI